MSDPKPPRIFYTELNSVHVSVYAELECEYDWADGWRITGNVYGPHCSLSDTLPARIKLKDRGNGQSLLSAASFPVRQTLRYQSRHRTTCYWQLTMYHLRAYQTGLN